MFDLNPITGRLDMIAKGIGLKVVETGALVADTEKSVLHAMAYTDYFFFAKDADGQEVTLQTLKPEPTDPKVAFVIESVVDIPEGLHVVVLGFNENATVSNSYSQTGIIEALTHAELVALINSNELKPGASYLINDYKTTYTQPVTDIAMEGTLEPIVVRAISDNELDPVAASTIYPQDILYYNVENDATGPGPTPTADPVKIVPGATKGFIYRRIDTKQNNDLPFDFRQVKFRRWKITSTGIYPNSGYASPQSTTFNALTVDDTDYNDFLFFSGSNYTTCYDNKIDGFISDRIKNINSVVGDNFHSNTIGDNFRSNTIGDKFYSNTIGNDFYRNTILGYFRSNTIGNEFHDNTIGDNFRSNTIGDNFYNNTIDNHFYDNTIGNNFRSNTIDGFQHNIVASDFSITGLDSATHVYGNYRCDIRRTSTGTWKLLYLDNATLELTVADPTA